MTRWNVPVAKSESGENELLNNDFGVMTISGLRHFRRTCLRSRWKICAGVVGLTTWMLSSAAKGQEAFQPGTGVFGSSPLQIRGATTSA